jgi:hypothetical protein
MTKEALKLALEALNSGVDAQVGRVVWTEYDSCLIAEAITAIKEALAQPAQKLVASMTVEDGRISFAAKILPDGTYDLYTTPQQRPWVGLTFAEICECENDSLLKFARAIEAALRSKNHD